MMTGRITFDGRTVIVTGAGGGLGRAYALDIAARGGAVVVNDLGGSVAGDGASASLADGVVADIVAAGGRAVASHDSVATPDGSARIAQTALDAFGRIDGLINNAGNMRFGALEDLEQADLDSLLAVHVGGAFHMSRAVWPHMKAQGYGRILFTTSSAGMFGSAQLAAYGAAKGGVMGLLNCLSEEGRPFGILCNGLMPNAVSRLAMAVGANILGENPWGRQFYPAMDPSFTAGLASYLASEACTSSHAIYSALGGRIGRVFVGVTDGWHGGLEQAPTAEQVAAHFSSIGDVAGGYAVPENTLDEFRIVAGAKGQ